MLTVRVSCPAALVPQVRAALLAEPAISSLSLEPTSGLRPPGGVFVADLPREAANDVIDRLVGLGVAEEGAIVVQSAPTWVSKPALAAEEAAPGSSADAVVWSDVVERAYDETELTWTYGSFMILAMALAAIAIVTDSVILVIGAMVIGPEFMAITALGLALVRRRASLFRQALRTLVIGFVVAMAVITAACLLGRLAGLITSEQILAARPGTAFIYTPNVWSFIVAVIAAAAGVLALTSQRASGLVGVFISVTTIPAAANICLGLAFGLWSEVAGSSLQLAINITGMALAGWGTLALQQFVWSRISRRDSPAPTASGGVSPRGRARPRRQLPVDQRSPERHRRTLPRP